jgi:alpha-tubulin suppressor-like RCC1 family protein
MGTAGEADVSTTPEEDMTTEPPVDAGGSGGDAGADLPPEEDLAEPDMVEPDMVEPDMVEPDMVEPDMGEPDMGEDEPPVLNLVEPGRHRMTPRRDIFLMGSVLDDGPVESVTVQAAQGDLIVEVDDQGSFAQWVPLVPGLNHITVEVTDAAGQVDQEEVEVYFGHRISVGNSQAAFLRSDGLYTWGRNELGQLGNGSLQGSGYGEDPETSQLPARYKLDRQRIVSVVTRQTFMIALDELGQVLTWGSNSDGQLGYASEQDCGSRGDSPCRREPTVVPDVSGVVAVQAGFKHSMALLEDGSVLTWGSNADGQLGYTTEETGSAQPAPVPGVTDVVQLAAGANCSYALTADGRVYAWGENNKGQLGLGASDGEAHTAPALIPGLEGVVAIAAGNRTGYALLADGTLRAWGQNHAGQVGNGQEGDDVPAPATVMTLDDQGQSVALGGVENIAADGFVAVALNDQGQMWTWGLGSLGQLGQGYLEDGERDLDSRAVASPVALTPEEVQEFATIEVEAGAGGPTLALTADSELLGWGWSFRGSMGLEGAIDAWAYSAPIILFSQP